MEIIDKLKNPVFEEDITKSFRLDLNAYLAMFFTIACPLFWSIGGRIEYHTKIFSKIFQGNSKYANNVFAGIAIILSIFRNYYLVKSLIISPRIYLQSIDAEIIITSIAVLIFLIGCSFVFGAYYRLGISGTYYGDHFGIVMDEKIESFPFNVTDHPMYNGAITIYLGFVVYFRSVTGILLLAVLFGMYKFAEYAEDPMTDKIYGNKEKEGEKQKEKEKQKAKKKFN